MTPRLLTVLTVLAVLLTVVYIFSSRPTPPAASPRWVEVDPKKLLEIRIQDGVDTPVVLSRTGDDWFRHGDTGVVRADTSAIGEMIGLLTGMISVDPVTDSPGKYSQFEVDTPQALAITLVNGGVQRVYIGKASEDGQFVFGRRESEPTVRAIRGFDRWRLERLIAGY